MEVYPISRIKQEIREQKDMYGDLDLHETYYKVNTAKISLPFHFNYKIFLIS